MGVFPPPEQGGCHGALGSPGIGTADSGIAPSLWVPWEPWAKVPVCSRGFGLGVGPRPMAPPCWGNTLWERLAGEYSPLVPLGYVLPDARGPLEVLVGLSSRLLPIFQTFLGDF